MGYMKIWFALAGSLFLVGCALGQEPQVASVDAGIGPCKAEFRVVDAAGKPVFDAKVHTLIKYGAFGIRKTELTVGTNASGVARITGLPDFNKRPIVFDVTKDGKRWEQKFEPGESCEPKYDVSLK